MITLSAGVSGKLRRRVLRSARVRAFDLVGAIHAASTPGIVAAASIDEAGMVCFRLVRLLAPKR